MVALLGLLAVAGYQNREKIAEALGARQTGPRRDLAKVNDRAACSTSSEACLAVQAPAACVSGGLRDLVERFKQSGHGQAADSWVSTGPESTAASGPARAGDRAGVLETLAQHTGLSKQELVSRLTRDLPAAVDKFTPVGRLPTEEEAARLV
jgi:uncharacterized protein YidB (DUF937 family)